MFISGIVVDLCHVRRAKRFREIGNASLVAAPHVGVRNKVSTTQSPRPNAGDASFGAIESNEYQMDLLAKRTSPIHQGEARTVRKSCLHGETLVTAKAPVNSPQYLPPSRDCREPRIRRVHNPRDCVGVQQESTVFHVDPFGEGRFASSVWTHDQR
jgi:hypothetical protein